MKYINKNLIKITLSFFVIGLVASFIFSGYAIYLENNSLVYRVHKHLEDKVLLKADLAESFLKAKKARSIDFASDGFIKDSLERFKQGEDSQKINEELRQHLIFNKMSVEGDIYEVFVLDINGKVVATTNLEEEFGEDFSNDSMFMEGKNNPFIKDIGYDDEFKKIGMAFSAPVLSEGELLGVVVIRMDIKELTEIIGDISRLHETEEFYIVNSEKYIVTPSRFLSGENGGMFLQVVDTENSRACIEDFEMFSKEKGEGIEDHKESITLFKDFRGEWVLGTHSYIEETRWCLLAEIEKTEGVDKPLMEYVVRQIVFSVFFIIIFTLLGSFIGRYLNLRVGGVIRKK
jgi:C4-dicarboxylate-specific signal transduction histidine kinase